MVDRPRFLIGYGERLTEPVAPPPGGSSPMAPYDVSTARARLNSMITQAVFEADLLPVTACPGDRVVTALTLHPTYVAKSYHPGALLRSAGFEQVGSKPIEVVPERIGRAKRDQDGKVLLDSKGKRISESIAGETSSPTTRLFVASTRADLRRWRLRIAESFDENSSDIDIVRIEGFELLSPDERLRLPNDLPDRVSLEVVLHGAGQQFDQTILIAFANYARSVDATAQMDRRYDAGTLSFIPVEVSRERIRDLANFSFLRIAREVPRMRGLGPGGALFRSSSGIRAKLPNEPPLDPELRIVVFDGGLAPNGPMTPWATGVDTRGLIRPVEELMEHGNDVTSVLLFGAIDSAAQLNQPLSYVDHYRVFDQNSRGDDFELFDVIHRIEEVLAQRPYNFVNLSIGPDLPIEDDEIHAWTAFIDSHLQDGRTLLTTAVGNNGRFDPASGNARIQVPADSVNALAIGAANSRAKTWRRAPYSAMGPGRSPGIVKPDLVVFGGTMTEPFIVVASNGILFQTEGTSFAAPLALRTAVGVRAVFGERLDALALKGLLIHTAEPCSSAPCREVGWGRASQDLEGIVVCPDGVARVIYQGDLIPGSYLRAMLPLPSGKLFGNVIIRASLVYATDVDPADPSNYTKSGLEVIFRPDSERFLNDKALNARTTPFFSRRAYASESELRRDAAKWETVLNESRTFRASSLNRPVFDIHYNARDEGHPTKTAAKMRYAMIISIESKKTVDLYDRVLQTYATQLEPLVPKIEIPIRLPTV